MANRQSFKDNVVALVDHPNYEGVRHEFGSRDGNGGGNDMDQDQKNYIDAKVDAVRAQNDARFTEVLSEIKALPSAKDIQATKFNTWGAVATGVTVLIALMAFGADRFDGGIQLSAVSVRDSVEAKRASTEALSIATLNAEQMGALNKKTDLLLDILQGRVKQ